MARNPPIFLRPAGRTGGTLFVTMLDAHPALAMSYEIYEDRLLDESGEPLAPSHAIELLDEAQQADPVAWVKAIRHKNLKTFAARARRADIEIDELRAELTAFSTAGGRFDTLDGRLDFIDRLMILRMRKIEKPFWGGKAAADLDVLYRRHPDAVFFSMVRDGRDVLASRLHTGNFQTNPLHCARDWQQKTREFRAFVERTQARAMEVGYERLVEDPEAVLREACELIGVDYDPQMLTFSERDMALFRNPHGHLSHKQIRQGLNRNSVGRWQRDLKAEDVAIFEQHCGELLTEYGYLLTGSGYLQSVTETTSE